MKIHYTYDPAAPKERQWAAWCEDRYLLTYEYDFVAEASTKHSAGFYLKRVLGAPEEEEYYCDEQERSQDAR